MCQWQPGYLSPFTELQKHATFLRGRQPSLSIKATTSLGGSIHPAQAMTAHDTETIALTLSGQSWASSLEQLRSFHQVIQWVSKTHVFGTSKTAWVPRDAWKS